MKPASTIWPSCAAFQDWNLRYALESVQGVAEVASVGGFVKQYQVDLDPNKLLGLRHSALRRGRENQGESNADVGGKTFEVADHGVLRARPRLHHDASRTSRTIPLKVDKGTPIYVKNVGTVHLGGDIRRGVAELDGKGETVGGIVVMRYGENALNVIDGVKAKLETIKARSRRA